MSETTGLEAGLMGKKSTIITLLVYLQTVKVFVCRMYPCNIFYHSAWLIVSVLLTVTCVTQKDQ